MNLPDRIFYFTQPPGLHRLGARCVTAGCANTEAGASYPPEVGHHPPSYRTVAWAGRALEEWQIVFIDKGRGSIAVGGSGHAYRGGGSLRQSRGKAAGQQVEAGDVLLLRPDEWHRYRPDPAVGWREFWVGFSGTFLDQSAAALGLLDAPAVIKVSDAATLRSLFESLLSLAGRNEVSAHMEMVAIILQLLTGVSRSTRQNASDRFSPEVVEASARMAAHLENRGRGAFSIEGVARDVGLSSSAFRKRFTAELGMTPYHYFNTLRVNEVKMQLAHSRSTLREIAERFGFTDQYHLSRVFKQYVGVSPTAWRRSGGEGAKSGISS